MSDAKDALLARVVEHLATAGVGDRSLRQMATGAATSHRMLIYHFGSRDALLVEVVRELERAQRVVLADLGARKGNPRDVALEFWHRLADPALAPYERLFFELYGSALAGNPGAAPVLDGVVTSWLVPIENLFAGETPARRRRRARMVIAFARGALLDLLATGDHREVDRAVREFITLTWPWP